APRLVNTQPAASQRRHAHAEDLPSAQMSMRRLGHLQQLIDWFHGMRLDAQFNCLRRLRFPYPAPERPTSLRDRSSRDRPRWEKTKLAAAPAAIPRARRLDRNVPPPS